MPARVRRRAVGPAGAAVSAGNELLTGADEPADERRDGERAAGRADDERLLADRPPHHDRGV